MAEVTPAIVPQMVDVELVAERESEAAPAPPAPPKNDPKPRKPEPKPVAKPIARPQPKAVETPPKKIETAPPKAKLAKPAAATETDDLAQRLKQLRESLGSDAASHKESTASAAARPAAKPASGGGARSAEKAASAGGGGEKTTTARADHLHNPRPPYPAVARARNWEGVSRMRVYVLPNGSAGQVQLAGSSGHDVLDEAAVAAVRGWRFVPAKRGDQAIASWVQFPIVWKLK
jgi:protein TonB